MPNFDRLHTAAYTATADAATTAIRTLLANAERAGDAATVARCKALLERI